MSDEAQGLALTWSAECAEIFAALALAQSAMTKLTKSKDVEVKAKDNPNKTLYTYTYADLPATLGACLDAYNANGCAVLQPTRVFNNGVEVTTIITHSSGQWIAAAPMFLPCKGNAAQDVGSGITYARRYALQAMAGLSPADDDGKRAHEAAPDSWERSTPRRQPPQRQQKDPLGPRCSGKKGGAIADANERRMNLLANEDPDAELSDVWLWGLGEAEIDVSKYDMGGPSTALVLTIPDGIKLRKLLAEKCIALGLEEAGT